MAQTGNNQVGVFTAPTNGQPGDANVVLSNDNATRSAHNAHDADQTIHVSSFASGSLPLPSILGRFIVTTDTQRAYFDTGAALKELAYLSTAGGTLTGALTGTSLALSGALTGTTATLSGQLTVTQGPAGIVVGPTSASSTNGASVVFRSDDGVQRWRTGLLPNASETAYSIYDLVAGAQRFGVRSDGLVFTTANFQAGGAVSIAGHLTPSVTAADDIGSSSLKFRDGYFSGVLRTDSAQLTSTLTVNGVSNLGSGITGTIANFGGSGYNGLLGMDGTGLYLTHNTNLRSISFGANGSRTQLVLAANGNDVSVGGLLTLTTAVSRIVSGATSFAVRDSANSYDLLNVSPSGVAGGSFAGWTGFITVPRCFGGLRRSFSFNADPDTPTNPAEGDFWFDGTNLKIRTGGVNRTVALV